MAKITAEEARGQNVVAFLGTLAWSERTDSGRQPTKKVLPALDGAEIGVDHVLTP